MKTKLTLVIADKLSQRLDIQAAVSGKGHDRSSIVEGLVAAHISLPDAVDAILTRPAEAKPSGSQATSDGPRSKMTFYLSGETARRLQLHATWTGEDRSEAVERLIREFVTPWDVYDPREYYRPARRRDRQTEAGPISSATDVAA